MLYVCAIALVINGAHGSTAYRDCSYVARSQYAQPSKEEFDAEQKRIKQMKLDNKG